MSYDESAISILEHGDAADRFDFVKVGELARQYPAISPAFIARLLAACRMVGHPIEPAIRRYLVGDKSVEISPELVACYVEQMRNP